MFKCPVRAPLSLLCLAAACARSPSPVAPHPATTRGLADTVWHLTTTVAANRAMLDSAVLEIHRVSGNPSSSAAARYRQLRKTAASVDSTYRANLARLLLAINAATAGSTRTSSVLFPIDAPPAPFVRAFADGSNWIIQSPLVHEIRKDTPYVVIIPRGFVTDFASLPQVLQILRGRFPLTGRYGIASAVHDYLYWRQDCTRAQADKIMELAMGEAGVPLLERKLIYEGVRQFGQSAWDGNRKARQDGLVRTVAPPDDQAPLTGTWSAYREWLRTTRARNGVEYPVPQSVCAIADSL